MYSVELFSVVVRLVPSFCLALPHLAFPLLKDDVVGRRQARLVLKISWRVDRLSSGKTAGYSPRPLPPPSPRSVYAPPAPISLLPPPCSQPPFPHMVRKYLDPRLLFLRALPPHTRPFPLATPSLAFLLTARTVTPWGPWTKITADAYPLLGNGGGRTPGVSHCPRNSRFARRRVSCVLSYDAAVERKQLCGCHFFCVRRRKVHPLGAGSRIS